ncbi:MAG: rhodanese [Methyloprofundus sp.]|nr:rhodanese [Methyloprofundus sp.]
MAVQEISPVYLQHQLLESSDTFYLLDVREPFEYEIAALANSVLIPMQTIPKRMTELDKSRAIVVICHHGVRSQQVAYFLDQQGFTSLYNLTGGIDAWARACDPEMAIY